MLIQAIPLKIIEKVRLNLVEKNVQILDLLNDNQTFDLLNAVKANPAAYLDLCGAAMTSSDSIQLLTRTIPPVPAHYIPRKLSKRVELNPDILNLNSTDVFVFKGINWTDLVSFVPPHTIGFSSLQTTKILSKFIILQHYQDWDLLRQNSKMPIHLVQYEEYAKSFLLLQTKGGSRLLRQFSRRNTTVHETKLPDLTEDRVLVTFRRGSDKCLLVSGDPGTGKSTLLASLAKQASNYQSNIISIFIQLSHFASMFSNIPSKEVVNSDFIKVAIADYICPSPLAKLIFLELVASGNIELDLFFDGIDEILPSQLGFIRTMLEVTIRDFQSTKVYVSSRSKRRSLVESTLRVISYHIDPLTENMQLEIITKYWKECDGLSNQARLLEVAKFCLANSKTVITAEQNSHQLSPLQCLIIAKIYTTQAQHFSQGKSIFADIDFETKKSLHDMYVQYMNLCFSQIKVTPRSVHQADVSEFETVFQTVFQPLTSIMEAVAGEICVSKTQKIRRFHTYHALKLTFPSIAEDYALYAEVKKAEVTSEYFDTMLIQQINIGNSQYTDFHHRTFAEYLAAFAFGDMFIASVSKSKKNGALLKKAQKFLLENVLATKGMPTALLPTTLTPIGTSTYVLHHFDHPVIVYFLNVFFENYVAQSFQYNQIKPGSFTLDNFLTPTLLYRILQACCFSNFSNLLRFIGIMLSHAKSETTKRFKAYLLRSDPELKDLSPMILLILTASKYTTKEFILQLEEISVTAFSISISQLLSDIPKHFITPLHLVISRGSLHLVEYFTKYISLDSRGLLRCCAQNTHDDPSTLLENKIKILRRLLNQQKDLISKDVKIGNSESLSPITAERIHWKFLQSLIQEGADIRATDEEGNSVAVKASRYMHANDYHELISLIIQVPQGANIFFQNPKKFPLHEIFMSRNKLTSATFSMLLKIPGNNPAQLDYNGNSLAHCAVLGDKEVNLLDVLDKFEVPMMIKNKDGKSVLHLAAENGDVPMIQYFLNKGIPVNEPDHKNRLPLHLANKHLEAIRQLVLSGSELLACDYQDNNFAHLAAEFLSSSDWKILVKFLVKNQKHTLPKLLNGKNRNGDTVIHILFKSEENVDVDALQYLLNQSSVNINIADNDQMTPLLIAVRTHQPVEVLRILTDHGAALHAENKYNETALHVAVANKNEPALRFLISQDSPINARNIHGQTPLQLALKILDHMKDNSEKGLISSIVDILRQAGRQNSGAPLLYDVKVNFLMTQNAVFLNENQ